MIIEKLKQLPQVVEAYKVDGSYDMIAKVTDDTVDKLKVLNLKIREIEQIRATLTLIIMKNKVKEKVNSKFML